MNILSDEWKISGNDIEKFFDEAEKLSKRTKTEKHRLTSLLMMYARPGTDTFLVFDANYVKALHHNKPCIGKVEKVHVSDEAVQADIENTAEVYKWLGDDEIRVLSGLAKNGLNRRLKRGGDRALSHEFGNVFDIADACVTGGETVTEIRRVLTLDDDSTISKTFAIMSEKYCPISQALLKTIVDCLLTDEQLGESVCRNWTISNTLSVLDIEYPDAAKELCKDFKLEDTEYVPGIRIMTSDVGECAITICGTMRHKRAAWPFVVDTVKRKHIGKVSIDEIKKRVDTDIFGAFRKFTGQMIQLMSEDITKDGWDLTTEAGRRKNRKAYIDIVDAYRECLEKAEVADYITDTVCDTIKDEFDGSFRVTRYDVVSQFFQMPERIVGDDATASAINKFSDALKLLPAYVIGGARKKKASSGSISIIA